MSRYIDADKPHNCEDCIHKDKQWYELPCDACCPAHSGFEPRKKTDVRENVRGRWKEIQGGYFCDNCEWVVKVGSNFCPNCGAQMDGGDEL